MNVTLLLYNFFYSALDWYHEGRGFESRQGRELLILNKKELLIQIRILRSHVVYCVEPPWHKGYDMLPSVRRVIIVRALIYG